MTLPQTDEEREELLKDCEEAVAVGETAKVLERLLGRLLEMYMAHWGAETWMTNCTGCAAAYDGQYAETVRAEKAEAALDAAERQVATLRAALEDFRDHGLRTDLMPTTTRNPSLDWWYRYLGAADRYVRNRARAALAPQPASGDLPPARSHGATGVLTSTDMSQTVAPSESRSESAGGMVEGGAE